MVTDTKECQGKWNFTCPVGLQALEVGAMVLGSFAEAEFDSVNKQEQANNAELANNRLLRRTVSSLCDHQQKEQALAFERSSHSLH